MARISDSGKPSLQDEMVSELRTHEPKIRKKKIRKIKIRN